MGVRRFALIFGIIYLVIGILGFIPGLAGNPTQDNFGPGGGYLLTLFPVNYVIDAVHAIAGVWGIAARDSAARAVGYARSMTILFLILGLLGLPEFFGSTAVSSWLYPALPVGSLDVILDLVSAAIAAWFGYGAPARAALPHG